MANTTLAHVVALETATLNSFPKMCQFLDHGTGVSVSIFCIRCFNAEHQLVIELEMLVVIVRKLM